VKYSSIEQLPPGARIGTSSLRREAQLRALRPDLDVHPLRGNVDTRLRKLESGEYDAIILAAAGLNRLARPDAISQIIPAEAMCPAAGQGALAIEIRAGDSAVRGALAFLDNVATRAETDCERALLRGMGGGCQVPIGALAKWSSGNLHLQAVVASPDGKSVLRDSAEGEDAAALGELLGSRLLKNGGVAILDLVYAQSAPQPEQP
jgi:hydroxymethylbilane synthase